MEKQSGNIPSTLTAAYEELHIDDPTISDKRVGVANLHAHGSAVEQPTEALQNISNARDSRWLQSTVTPIPGPLTERAVATLQDGAHSVSATTSDVMVQPTSNIFGPIPTAIGSSEGQERAVEKANSKAGEGPVEKANEEASTDEADSLEFDSLSSQSTYAPSSSEEYASDSFMEPDLDDCSDYDAWFDWDDDNDEGGSWTCDCGEAFIDGKCPYGHCGFCKSCGFNLVGDHCVRCPQTCPGCGGDKFKGKCAECKVKRDIIMFSFCKSCGWNIFGDCPRCPKTCQGCGEDKVSGACAECDPKKEEIKVRRDVIVFDDKDGVWRCSECQWEIEADGTIEGNCHCQDEEGGMRMVDLSQIPEYQRADYAVSSTESSSDEEGDSDDEDFIDDREDVMEDERFWQRVDSDKTMEAAQGGGLMDSNTTLDDHDLTSPTSSGPEDSKI